MRTCVYVLFIGSIIYIYKDRAGLILYIYIYIILILLINYNINLTMIFSLEFFYYSKVNDKLSVKSLKLFIKTNN